MGNLRSSFDSHSLLTSGHILPFQHWISWSLFLCRIRISNSVASWAGGLGIVYIKPTKLLSPRHRVACWGGSVWYAWSEQCGEGVGVRGRCGITCKIINIVLTIEYLKSSCQYFYNHSQSNIDPNFYGCRFSVWHFLCRSLIIAWTATS